MSKIHNSYPKSDVWNHWTVIDDLNGRFRVKCKYCGNQQLKNATKCAKHTAALCKGHVPPEVRTKFLEPFRKKNTVGYDNRVVLSHNHMSLITSPSPSSSSAFNHNRDFVLPLNGDDFPFKSINADVNDAIDTIDQSVDHSIDHQPVEHHHSVDDDVRDASMAKLIADLDNITQKEKKLKESRKAIDDSIRELEKELDMKQTICNNLKKVRGEMMTHEDQLMRKRITIIESMRNSNRLLSNHKKQTQMFKIEICDDYRNDNNDCEFNDVSINALSKDK